MQTGEDHLQLLSCSLWWHSGVEKWESGEGFSLNFLRKGSAKEPLNFGILFFVGVQESRSALPWEKCKDWHLIKISSVANKLKNNKKKGNFGEKPFFSDKFSSRENQDGGWQSCVKTHLDKRVEFYQKTAGKSPCLIKASPFLRQVHKASPVPFEKFSLKLVSNWHRILGTSAMGHWFGVAEPASPGPAHSWLYKSNFWWPSGPFCSPGNADPQQPWDKEQFSTWLCPTQR